MKTKNFRFGRASPKALPAARGISIPTGDSEKIPRVLSLWELHLINYDILPVSDLKNIIMGETLTRRQVLRDGGRLGLGLALENLFPGLAASVAATLTACGGDPIPGGETPIFNPADTARILYQAYKGNTALHWDKITGTQPVGFAGTELEPLLGLTPIPLNYDRTVFLLVNTSEIKAGKFPSGATFLRKLPQGIHQDLRTSAIDYIGVHNNTVTRKPENTQQFIRSRPDPTGIIPDGETISAVQIGDTPMVYVFRRPLGVPLDSIKWSPTEQTWVDLAREIAKPLIFKGNQIIYAPGGAADNTAVDAFGHVNITDGFLETVSTPLGKYLGKGLTDWLLKYGAFEASVISGGRITLSQLYDLLGVSSLAVNILTLLPVAQIIGISRKIIESPGNRYLTAERLANPVQTEIDMIVCPTLKGVMTVETGKLPDSSDGFTRLMFEAKYGVAGDEYINDCDNFKTNAARKGNNVVLTFDRIDGSAKPVAIITNSTGLTIEIPDVKTEFEFTPVKGDVYGVVLQNDLYFTITVNDQGDLEFRQKGIME